MTGHANAEELRLVERLESAVDLATSPIEDVLELGQLYIEPCHREADAIRLFEGVLKRDPHHIWAKFWLAYCCLHYLMDREALRRARTLLESVMTRDPQHAGAACMLLAEVLEEEQGSASLHRQIRLLEASVGCEPGWVYNRQALSRAYRQAGRLVDAVAQIRAALSNVMVADPSWTVTTRNFEESITGRIGHRVAERLASDLKEIEHE